MNDSPLSPLPIDGRAAFAKSLLKVSVEVDAAELQLKREIQQAAEVGDIARVADIIAAWISEPVVEVLSRDMPVAASDSAPTEPRMP